MLDITISIVTYNSASVIENVIDSLLSGIKENLTYKIFIIDNDSSDDTLKKLEKYESNIEVIRNEKNMGFGAAHNMVLGKIYSAYHIVVNPDIIVNDSVIPDMYKFMENHESVGLLTPMVKYPNGNIQYLCKIHPNFIDLFIRVFMPSSFKNRQARYMMLNEDYNQPFKVPYATGCFMFFRTELFKQIGGFDERFFLHFEDADITRRVNEISKTLFYPYNYVVHDWKRESRKKPKLLLYMIISAFKYFKKWGFSLY